MGIDSSARDKGRSAELPLASAYRVLNGRRMAIDRQMSGLAEDDAAREMLWQSLQPIMHELRVVVTELARVQATDLPGLQSKAAILADLLRAPDGDTTGPIILESDRNAFALSLMDDIARFATG